MQLGSSEIHHGYRFLRLIQGKDARSLEVGFVDYVLLVADTPLVSVEVTQAIKGACLVHPHRLLTAHLNEASPSTNKLSIS